VDKTGQ